MNLLIRCIFKKNIPLTLKIFYVHVQNTNYAELTVSFCLEMQVGF